MPNDWSREEVEVIVADYLAMLEGELSGTPYDKTEHRRRLLPLLNGRSEGSIEFKHQNISAVLINLGIPYIPGYKPRFNYQRLLHEVVADRFAVTPNLTVLAASDADRPADVPSVEDILKVLTDPPRLLAPGARVAESSTRYFPSRINYLEREARNQSLGLAGEEFIVNFERARLINLHREKLASRIERVSGDAEGFDILSFETSGVERLIEVKTTKYGRETPFFVSRNELRVSEARAERYHLYRLFAFRQEPRLFMLQGALSRTCVLDPYSYIVTVA